VCVKTTISLPDDTFLAVERRIRELGLTRSQFFAAAARRYLEELDRSALTRQINEALTRLTADDSAAAAVAAGRALLAGADDW
jgi:metal-responsive CopG/Arc/MetJ family transcriptional regulator